MTNTDKPQLDPIPEKVKRRLRDAARRESKSYVLRLFALSMREQVAVYVMIFVVIYASMELLDRFESIPVTPFILGETFVISIGLLIWDSVKRERARKERRQYCPDGRMPICLNCEYDLRGTVTDQCPECGEPVFRFSK